MISAWQTSVTRADMADWITVAGYLAAASLCARAAFRARLRREARESVFWRIAVVLLILLGFNELLDLQTLLTSTGRAVAQANGWYEQRRSVQYLFVIGLGLAASCAGLAILWLTRRTHPAIRMALLGFAFIGLFVLLRAASFHHLDDILGSGMSRFNFGSFQEVSGILIVASAAIVYLRRRE